MNISNLTDSVRIPSNLAPWLRRLVHRRRHDHDRRRHVEQELLHHTNRTRPTLDTLHYLLRLATSKPRSYDECLSSWINFAAATEHDGLFK